MGTAFNGNTSITKFNELYYFSNIQNNGLPNGNGFKNCTALAEITLPPKITDMNSIFIGCRALKKIYFPVGYVQFHYGVFECNGTNTELFIPTLSSTHASAMYNGTYILVMSEPTPTTNVPGNAARITKVYVPDASVDAYKSAWSAVASKIYPLSDYDGSIISPVLRT